MNPTGLTERLTWSGKHLFLKADNATKIGVRLDDVSITKEIGMDI